MDNQSSEERTLLFIDTKGKQYYAHKTTSTKTIVDISTLPSQLYFVSVVDSAGHPLMVSKFVKID